MVVFAEKYTEMMEFLKENRSRMHEEGYTLLDLSRDCAYTVCTLDLPGPENIDLLMDGPFDEPDEYFLRRQRKAYGNDADALASEE